MDLAQTTETAAQNQDRQCLDLSLKLADCLDVLITELRHYLELHKGNES